MRLKVLGWRSKYAQQRLGDMLLYGISKKHGALDFYVQAEPLTADFCDEAVRMTPDWHGVGHPARARQSDHHVNLQDQNTANNKSAGLSDGCLSGRILQGNTASLTRSLLLET